MKLVFLLAWFAFIFSTIASNSAHADINKTDFITKLNKALPATLCSSNNNLLARCYSSSPTDCAKTMSSLVESCSNDAKSLLPAVIKGSKPGDTANDGGRFSGMIANCAMKKYIDGNKGKIINSEECRANAAGATKH